MTQHKLNPTEKEKALRFIHGIGHELKQPLSLIKAYTYYLSKYLPVNDKEARKYPEKIDRQVDILVQMLNDVAESTRLSTQSMKIKKQKMNLVTFLKKIIADLKTAHPDRSITFTNNLPKIIIIGDKIRLRQAMMNLIVNAINYSEPSDPIEVKLKSNDKSITIKVKDQGIGMSSQEIRHVFEPYFRTADSKKRGVNGLGLGLALVKDILRIHQANISVQSKPGKGSTFTIRFPKMTNVN